MKQVKFDYVSDLHLDFWAKSQYSISQVFNNKEANYLIVAGDIGHNLKDNIAFLKSLKEAYGYQEIFIVLGNHDRYLFRNKFHDLSTTGKDKAIFSRKEYSKNGIKVLDGDIFEVEGITIGGADGWYDGRYVTNRVPLSKPEMLDFWKKKLNDFNSRASDDFYITFLEEIEKIKPLYGQVDVMVTHVRPTVLDEHTFKDFQGDNTNAFFGFDYSHQISKDPKLKVWVYGHVHNSFEGIVGNCKLLCNPLGYPGENPYVSLRTFSVEI